MNAPLSLDQRSIGEETSPEDAAYAFRILQTLTALEEFYEPLEAMRWLRLEQALLGGRKPAELLKTEDGTIEVNAVIARLRDGAYI